MAEQWLRSYRLQLGEADPLGLGLGFVAETNSAGALSLAFKVEADETPTPNQARIQIRNLNPAHRDWLSAQRAVPCVLEAGYQSGMGVVFSGVLREVSSVHTDVDWVTTLAAGDGEFNRTGEPLARGSIKKSWKKGTPLAKVLLDFARELDLDLGNAAAAAATSALRTGPVLLRSLAVDGPIVDEWIYLCRALGLTWSVQGGALQLRQGPLPAGIGPVVSPFTGLVGQVEKKRKLVERSNLISKKKEIQTIDTVEGRCLLLPGLRPGYQFALQSAAATGLVLCTNVTHEGDTASDTWYTSFIGAL